MGQMQVEYMCLLHKRDISKGHWVVGNLLNQWPLFTVTDFGWLGFLFHNAIAGVLLCPESLVEINSVSLR